jgi:hypothetical protein
MLKISPPRIVLMNQAQTVKGKRGRVMPWARRSITVMVKMRALSRDAAQKMPTLTIQRVMAGWGGKKNVAVRPKSEATVSQNAKRFSAGKAISRAPMLQKTKELEKYLRLSYAYAKTLKPKATKKKGK